MRRDPAFFEAVKARYDSGLSIKAIARELNSFPRYVSTALREQGVTMRSHRESCVRLHSCDEAVFDDPNEDGQYWIGFLMADGNVRQDFRHDSWKLTLGASEKDAAHIERFRNFLSATNPIRITSARSSKMPRGRTSVSTPFHSIVVTSKRLCAAVARFGVVPRKSLTAQVIGLETSPHFWRGAVDGDGFVSWHENPSGRSPIIGLIGSRDLVGQFESFVRSICPNLKARSRPAGSVFHLRIVGDPAKALAEVLYPQGVVALDRKRRVADEFASWVNRRTARVGTFTLCNIEGCERRRCHSSGRCRAHERRMSRHGTTTPLRDRLGEGRSAEYKVWCSIKRRCYNPNEKSYRFNGAVGIVMCDRWRDSFRSFLEDMGRRPSDSHFLRRDDEKGNFEPGNCKWAPREVGLTGSRKVRMIEFQGRSLSLNGWARETGIKVATIHMRLKMGWSAADALTTPVRATSK